MKRRLFTLLGTAVVAAALTLTLPGAASALDDGGGQWAPGRALVKFDAANMEHDGVAKDEIATRIRAFLRSSLGAKIVATLPLIPDAYTIEFDGDLSNGLVRLAEIDRDGHAKAWIAWEQPDYVAHLQPNSGPTESAYWPDDPYFWPRTWSNPNACGGNQVAMGQPNLWPLFRDLRDPSGPWAKYNPTPRDVRPALNYRQIAASSIDVLPVWDALGHHTQGRSGGDGQVWLPQDLRRSGIAIWDSGIANNPDVGGQVAGVIGVGKPRNEADTEVALAYGRGVDRAALRHALVPAGDPLPAGVKVTSEPRASLFPLDDVTPSNSTPTGCDGHGTEVASVAGAAAANGEGIVGVGWDVPLVGIRPLRPWDNGVAHTVAAAQQLAAHSPPDEVFDDTVIDQLAVAKALKLPVVNMSFGEQLFARRPVVAPDPEGKKREVKTLLVEHPAVVEALARAFAGDATLGVASAGEGHYGTQAERGAALSPGASDAAQAPCGLRMLGASSATVFSGAVGGGTPKGTLQKFTVPGVNFNALNLICVADSRTTTPQLDPNSGFGDAAVDLAAPAVTIPVATRPGGSADPATWYRRATGTSFAAAEVSGAAALLREVAPGADMSVIARALRLGARPQIGLLTKVRYGLLDVACSALWLIDHQKPEWNLRITTEALGDPAKDCFKPSIATYTSEWRFPESYFNPNVRFGMSAFRRRKNGDKVVRDVLSDLADREGALTLQNTRLLPDGSNWPRGEIAFFPIAKNGFSKPVAPPDRTMYNFADVNGLPSYPVTCPPNTELVDFELRMKSFLPKGYVYASPDSGDNPNRISLNVAMIKPFVLGLVPNPIRVAITMQCGVLASDGG
jgi:hypothetical protein